MRFAIGMATVLLFGAAASYAQGPLPPPNTNHFGGNEKAVAEGQEIYNGVCTGCHGRDGGAGDRAPALGDPARKYIRNSDDELFDAIRKGMPGSEMPPSGLSET